MAHLRTASHTDEISKVGAVTGSHTRNRLPSQRSDCSEHTATDFSQRLKSVTNKVRRDSAHGDYLYGCLEAAAPWLPSVKDSEYYFLYPKNIALMSNIAGILIMVIRSSTLNILQDSNVQRSIAYEIVTRIEPCSKGKRTAILCPGEIASGIEYQSEISIGVRLGDKDYLDTHGPFSCLDSDISAFCSLLSTTTTKYKKLSGISVENAIVHSIKNLNMSCSASYDDETRIVVQTDLMRSLLFNMSTPRFPRGRQGMTAYTVVNDLSFRQYGRYSCHISLRRVLLLTATLVSTPTFELCDSKNISSHRSNKVTANFPDVVVKLQNPFIFSSSESFPWWCNYSPSLSTPRSSEQTILSPDILASYFHVPLHANFGSTNNFTGTFTETGPEAFDITRNIIMNTLTLQNGNNSSTPSEKIIKNIDHTKVHSVTTPFVPGTRILGGTTDIYRRSSVRYETNPQSLLVPITNTESGLVKGPHLNSASTLPTEQTLKDIKDNYISHLNQNCDLTNIYEFSACQSNDELFDVCNTNTYINVVDKEDLSELSRSDSPIVQSKRPMTSFSRSKPKLVFGKLLKKKDESKEEVLPPFLSVAATKDGLKHEPKLVAQTTCNGNEMYKRIVAVTSTTESPINYTKVMVSQCTKKQYNEPFSNRGPNGEDKFYHLKFKCGDGTILVYVEFTREYGGLTEGHVIMGQSHFQWDVTIIAGPQVLDLLVGGKYVDSIYLSSVGDYNICFKLLDRGAWIDLSENYDVFARVL
ncbi:Hypothetical protein GLP15_3355 [Giardia lamblia P15]|uniref:Uncharacterized protein n=1 Tax=Giardia intestinalis (strain P15) TaxID=658858 RepID=E1EVV2_GIAIA|nr:Hypothetical protein GLP15_3355 [Giardia lamblia P15]